MLILKLGKGIAGLLHTEDDWRGNADGQLGTDALQLGGQLFVDGLPGFLCSVSSSFADAFAQVFAGLLTGALCRLADLGLHRPARFG